MAKNNFDYSIDVVNKMRNILLPDVISLVKRKFKERKLEYQNYAKGRQLMTVMLIGMLGKKVFVDEFAINGKPWAIVIYTINGSLMLALRELEHDTIFRYNVAEFDDEQFNAVINYIYSVTTNAENSDFIKNKTSIKKPDTDE